MLQEGDITKSQSESVETLRLILEHEQARSIIYEEAFDVGESLITFFEVLAESDASNE